MNELPIIQKTYDLIKWYVPQLMKLPRDHKFTIGDRVITSLYNLLDGLIRVRFSKSKQEQLLALFYQYQEDQQMRYISTIEAIAVEDTQIDIAKSLLQEGVSVEIIKLSIERVRELQQQLNQVD